MPSNVILTDAFRREAKKLAKKYRSLGQDLAALVAELEEAPYSGDRLGPNTYKLRLAIRSRGRGKSGGARVISYVAISIEENVAEDAIDVALIALYDKSKFATVPASVVDQRIADYAREEE